MLYEWGIRDITTGRVTLYPNQAAARMAMGAKTVGLERFEMVMRTLVVSAWAPSR